MRFFLVFSCLNFCDKLYSFLKQKTIFNSLIVTIDDPDEIEPESDDDDVVRERDRDDECLNAFLGAVTLGEFKLEMKSRLAWCCICTFGGSLILLEEDSNFFSLSGSD